MPNDAKLGLVAGLAVVLAVAAIFFRSETFKRDSQDPAASARVQASESGKAPDVTAQRE